MGTLIRLFLLALAVGLASSLNLEPVFDDGCSSECIGDVSSGNIAFDENVKYTYSFTGKTTIIAPNNDPSGISEVSISGKANIIGTLKCGVYVYLKNIQITQGSQIYQETRLEGYPALISYNNGRVGPRICASIKESIASMNLKRAIVSALQVASVQGSELIETDVQGTCKTVYSVAATDSYSVITKSKNLAQCTGYDKIGMFASQSNQDYEDSPFSEATQQSKIQIAQSMIRSVNSQETFLYQPLGPMGLVTKIMTSMDLSLDKRSSVRIPMISLNQIQSIVFEKPSSTVVSTNADQLVKAVQLAMADLEPVVEMNGAQHYMDLVALLGVAKKDDILSAYEQIKSSTGPNRESPNVAEKIFIDAIIAANTGQSIEAVVELIKSNKLCNSMITSWFINLAKAKYPTKESLVATSSLLDDKVLKEGYMGVGALMRQYLKNTNDYNSPEISNALRNLGAPVQNMIDNSMSSVNEDIVIASLKGLENAQYINDELEDTIVKTIMSNDVSQRVRAAALAVAKTYATYSKMEKACQSIFTDVSEDSELRILAFKVYAMYPSNNKAAVIKSVLDDKTCQLQIQAYLSSYLNNLKTTVDETKLDQKNFYQGINSMSTKRSIGDILRYSQNLELFHMCPILHSGALLSGDVIYSYNSFLPRSYSASLRALIFGRSQNIFDFDIRVENIESMLEKLFGPNGNFAQSNEHPINNIINYITQAVKYAKERGLNEIDSQMPSENDENTSNDNTKKLYLDLALKVLGNDVGWFAFQADESKITYQHIIDAILDQINGVSPKSTKDMEFNFRKQLPIIDYDKKYATSSGLPITLKIQATAAVKLNMATKFDLQSYISQPENSNFALKFVPSGTMTMNTVLTINGQMVDVGHKVGFSLHTSTGSDVTVETVDGRGFEIAYGLPLNVMDVFSLRTGAYQMVQEKGSPLVENPLGTTGTRQSYGRTFDQLSGTTGLAIDVQYDFPWDGHMQSLLPFSGPAALSFKVLKTDSKLTKYVLKGVYDFNSPALKYVKLVLVTPKSDVSRGVELFAAYESQPDSKLIAEFRTPSASASVQATVRSTDELDGVELRAVYDDTEYTVNAGVAQERVADDTVRYMPVLGATYASRTSTRALEGGGGVDGGGGPYESPVFQIEGHVLVKYASESSAASEIKVDDLAVVTAQTRHSVSGSLTVDDGAIDTEASISDGSVTIMTRGHLGARHPVYSADGSFDMVRSDGGGDVGGGDDDNEYRPTSGLFSFLRSVKTLSASADYQLRAQSPYAFRTENRVLWNDDRLELGASAVIDANGELTADGRFFTSNLLDLSLNANLTIQPRTADTGVLISGNLEHSFISDASDHGFGNIKYVQYKDKSGGYFEFNSECPQIAGIFHLNTEHRLTDDKFELSLNYDVHDAIFLKVDLNAEPTDISFDLQFDYPQYPGSRSYVIAHGWLENENVYSFNTKIQWPGTPKLNYLNADGTLYLNENQNNLLDGNVDWPSANLRNVRVSVENTPSAQIENGGIFTVNCVSKGQVLFSEQFKYTLSINNGEYSVSGESIPDNSQYYIPVNFALQYNNYMDESDNICRNLSYSVVLEHDGQTFVHEKFMHIADNEIVYRQLHRVDNDEQLVSIDFEYDYTDYCNWYYDKKFKIVSPGIFHLLAHDDQDLLMYDSSVKLNGFSLDLSHALNIYTLDALSASYELKYFINDEQSAFQYTFGERQIQGLAQYKLNPIPGGYQYSFIGDIWLDFKTNPDSKSSVLIDTFYSIGEGFDSLSAVSDLQVFIPLFNNKEISVKTDIQLFQSFKMPLYAKLDLDIFPTAEQKLEIQTSFNRDNKDNGVLYSAEIQASSEGMQLDYLIKDSLFISSDKWGKYFEASFIDSDNIERPIQLDFEFVPSGFTTKMNIYDIMVINVDSIIDIQDDLNTRSLITYNGVPYSILFTLTSYPSFILILGWNDKPGVFKELKVEGSFTIDDSTVMSVTHIMNNEETVSVGTVGKSLKRDSWWETENQIDSDQWNLVWKSLKREFIERFIMVNNNMKNINVVTKSQRRVRILEARRAIPQYDLVKTYMYDEWSQIFDEILNDDYILKSPLLTLNCTKLLLSDVIDFVGYMDSDSCKQLSISATNYAAEIANYYKEETKLFLDILYRAHVKLHAQFENALVDLYYMFNEYTDKPVNDSSETHSLKQYLSDVIYKCITTVKELKITIDNLQDKLEVYIKNMPIYDMFYDQIEKLKTYPYKERLWEEIHKNLQDFKDKIPNKDFITFINALDTYLDIVIHDKPLDQKEIISLRNKTILVVKSFIFDFSDYVSYDRGMNIYSAMQKITKFGKTVLYVISPNSFKYPNNDQRRFLDFTYFYKKYLNPAKLLPPFKAQGIIVGFNNIITYNGRFYTFMPDTGSYILAKDFVNNKFSILVNYNNNVLSSITVTIDDGNTYELLSGGTITINGNNVNLPFFNDNIKAWQDVYFFGIKMSTGLTIKCTMPMDIVHVSINGFYYGRVYGLMGSTNQEPMFDLNLPDGHPSDDMESFVTTYGTPGNAKPRIINPVQSEQQPCPKLFSGVSSLKSIFPVIMPMPYRSICNQMVSIAMSEQDRLDKACLVAKSYVSMARENYIFDCSIPDMCITSMVDNQMVSTKSLVQISTPSNMADVMILIEEVPERQQAISEVLKSFMNKLVKSFNYRQINNVKFIIVGYSGISADSNVHVYSTSQDTNYNEIINNMQEWSSPSSSSPLPFQLPDQVNESVQSAENSRVVQSLKKVIGESGKDKAYRFSAEYPYRPNAVKSVLSVAQSLYDESSMDVSFYTFDYIKSSFAEQGIKFYLVAPINLVYPPNPGAFGASGLNMIYTMSAPKGMEIEDEFTYEKSLETDLVLKTNGAMYDSQFFVDGTANQQNYFLRSLGRTISYDAAQEADSAKSCSASAYNGVMPYVKCGSVVMD